MRWAVTASMVILTAVMLAAQTSTGPAASQPAGLGAVSAAYSSDFTKGGPQWSNGRIEMPPAGKAPILGRFTNDTVTLSLHNLPPHQFVRIAVDFIMLLDNKTPAGTLTLRVKGGPLLMKTSFLKIAEDKATAAQILLDEMNPKPAIDLLGYNIEGAGQGNDRTYATTFAFQHDAADLELMFAADGIGKDAADAWAVGRVVVETQQPSRLSREQMESLWTRMALPDLAEAREAQDILASAGDDAADFIKTKFSAAIVNADKVANLITQLDAEEFQTRQEASKALKQMGPSVSGALRDALKKTESEEVRNSLQVLLAQLSGTANSEASGNPAIRAIKMLASLRSAKAIEALETIETNLSDTRMVAAAQAARLSVAALLAPSGQRPGHDAIELDGPVSMQLVLAPAGKFVMGAADGARDEGAQHEVSITRPFYIGASLVTVAQYQAVAGNGPAPVAAPANAPPGADAVAGDPPASAARVSWADADAFCRALSQRTDLDVRLPTEAQWEYACRAGGKGKWCFGDSADLAEHFTGDARKPSATLPNAWGLFDMCIVDQWCADGYAENYYASSPGADPLNPAGGNHVLRGGPSAKRASGNGTGSFRVVIGPLASALRYCRPVRLANFKTDGKTASIVAKVALNNNDPGPSQQQAAWSLPAGCKWKVAPQTIEANLAPGASQEADFVLSYDGSPSEAYPLPELAVTAAGKDAKILPPVSLNLRDLFKACPSRATAPRATAALKLSGDLKDPAWANAAVLARFVDANAEPNIPQPTEVRVLYDDKALYLGIRCFDANERMPMIHQLAAQKDTPHDSPIYGGDCVEIFVDPNAGLKTYYQFISNPAGAQYEGEKWDASWNSAWQAKAGKDDKSWTLEIALPWESLGVKNPKPGYKLGLNLIRSRASGYPLERTMWSPVFSNTNHVATRLGQITLGE